MMCKTTVPVLTLCVVALFSHARAAAQPADAGNAELAERIGQMAHLTLSGQIVDSTLRQATALLEAATRLNPREPRFQRLLADAYLEIGDVGHAVDVLAEYRKLQPNDQAAQVQIIDLFTGQMEAADERLRYLRDLAETQALPRVVRSHAAGRAALLLAERAQEGESIAMTEQALELNPVNLDALQLQYQRAMQSADRLERFQAALAWLRANPALPELLEQVAYDLGEVGLAERSAHWFGRSFSVVNGLGQSISASTFSTYAAQLYLSGQVKLAEASVMQVLEADPTNPHAWFVRLVIARDNDNQEQTKQLLDQSRRAIIAQISALHGELSGTAPAQTEQLPDLMADAKRLNETNNEVLRDFYATAVGDLAWHQIYFARNPQAAAPLIDALRAMMPEQNVIVPRLEGWALLVGNRGDEARVKLAAIADRDPLAALGVFQIDSADDDAETRAEQAQRLLRLHPGGLIGALLQQALRPHGAKVAVTDAGQAVQAELDRFPQEWLDVTERPDQFYALRAQAMKVSHQLGEPVLVRVTLQNLQEYPITIDPRGLLRPDLWFDAQVRGPMQQTLTGIAYDRLGQRTVLGAQESISQVVRVDRGPAAEALARAPLQFIPMFFSVVTNPLTATQGIRPGPGGYRVQVDRVVERTASPLASAQHQQRVMTQLAGNDPVAKIRALDLLAAYVRMIRAAPEAGDELQKMMPQLLDAIENTTGDTAQSVQSYSRFVLATLYPGEKQQAMIQQMAVGEQWERRLLATALAALLPGDQRDALLEKLSGDADQTVSAYARATRDALVLAAAQPAGTTQPTTLPVPGVQDVAPVPVPVPQEAPAPQQAPPLQE
jgi:tetratricopeptide (TPR) repeat protein